jgi:anti-sigma B factor antagonist
MSAQAGSASQFAVELSCADVSTAVIVRGEIDVATAPRLGTALAQAEARRRGDALTPSVVVDLSDVQFMDASGLGVLVGAARSARRHGDVVVLRAPSPTVMRLLEITRLLDAFRIETATLELAAAS